jgi:uncharacterized membrane protein
MVSAWIRTVAWLSFAATMYLILTEAVAPWFSLPELGSIGFTLVFALFAVTHCIALEGLPRAALFFGVSAVVSYLMEEIGVRTGLVYGAYHYGAQLGAKLGHVPVIIPLAWFMMIYPSWVVAGALVDGINTRSLFGVSARAVVAALTMTAWDMVMDPGMAAGGNWIWEKGGVYFGVPPQNYVGWLTTTFLVYWIVAWLWRRPVRKNVVTKMFHVLPIIAYAFFAVRYVASNHFPALQLVALFSMGTPAFVALVRARAHSDLVTGPADGS